MIAGSAGSMTEPMFGHGWAVITRWKGGRWDSYEEIYYCRWIWQANREADRIARRVVR